MWKHDRDLTFSEVLSVVSKYSVYATYVCDKGEELVVVDEAETLPLVSLMSDPDVTEP